ncbi:D-alanine--poly(phosphoribitol) ligase subunit DltA [Schleiferilactobacillus shenzhenensis]|nr:D-alanine--poly(phosphoribitol) ligase subunit DltA [Schleiferilactobacillus shenzhenensis]
MIENIISQIDKIAEEHPERLAYTYEDHTYTFGELVTTADRIAHFLQAQHLPAKAPVVVYGEQTFAMVATFLGAVKSGHGYIPIDTNSPDERIHQIHDVAQPAAILATEHLPVSFSDLPIYGPEQMATVRAKGETDYDHGQSVRGDDIFYIIFTSGTTGVPKGVQISHTNLLSYVNWAISDFSLPEGIRCLAQAPYSFDLSVMDLYPSWVLGGNLVALPKRTTDNFMLLFKALPQLKLQEWVSTPSFVEICLLDANFKAANYPDLKYFLFCGEELTGKTASQLIDRFPDAKIFNTYGPTETTVAVTGVEITKDTIAQYERLPIGYAKEDTTMYAVDAKGNKVAPGELGELIIEGPSVSKGYLNNPEKTKSAFFRDGDQQAYRSGDLGFIDQDGLIFYRGRTDFQVKLHGFRIELEDVDHALDALAPVKQASVVPKYNNLHKVTQLVAFVVPKKHPADEGAYIADLKKQLTQTAMSYMIPQRIELKESLPLTVNGKIDRKTLIAEVNPS